MIKKLIILLLVSAALWGVIRHLNNIPTKSQLVTKPHKINNVVTKSTAIPEKKFIPAEIMQSKEDVTVKADNVINANQIEPDFVSHGHHLKKNAFHTDEMIKTDAATARDSRISFIWNGVKLTIIKTPANRLTQENTGISKQQPESEDPSNANETDSVSCPSVEKIQLAAQQISDVLFYDGTYRLTTYGPVFQDNNLTWLVGVSNISADSSDEAIYKANIAVSETNYRKVEYAEMMKGPSFTLYFCSYGPGDIAAVGIRNEVLVEE